MNRPIVFVATPLKPEPGDPGWPIEAERPANAAWTVNRAATALHSNMRFAEQTCRAIAQYGGAPFAPHLLYTRFLDDAKELERDTGIECGLAVMWRSDEVWFRLPSWRKDLSGGMKAELVEAEEIRKAVEAQRRVHVTVIANGNHFESELRRLRRLYYKCNGPFMSADRIERLVGRYD